MRLDQQLLARGLFSSRSLAQDAIKEGRVQVNQKVVSKSAFDVNEEDVITLTQEELTFASRAGHKLYHAIKNFEINLNDKIVLDVGASTGGFSDVCLQQGAKLVYAVDVGSGQLIQHLLDNPKVINMENTNCRYLSSDLFPIKPQFVCMDVSFISILTILPSVISVLDDDFELVLLIKPQFEAGKKDVGKNGLVKDMKVHQRVINEILEAITKMNLIPLHLQASTLKGRDGNQEYLLHCRNHGHPQIFHVRNIVMGRNE